MTAPELGIIEGYFGRSWSWEARADVIDRLAPAGYQFFHYAPKIDGRLRRDWQQLHDAEQSVAIGTFAAHCRERRVRFGIGLTPYGAQLGFDDAARQAMKAKLAQFDEWGIDDLAILFDDMRGDIADLAARQADIAHFICANSKASRFFLCPSYYTNDPLLDLVFGARPADYLSTLGRLLDPALAIYWTGEEVCSVEIGTAHLRDVAQLLGRKVALWDNYPVNDGPLRSRHLLLRAFTGREPAIGDHITHHAINPALQPVLGCIPALTLPMRYGRPDAYRYGAAFLEAATTVCGPTLAAMLQHDLMAFQDRGLDRLTEKGIGTLHERYAAIDHPAAREIIDWLAGGYAITGEQVRTQ
jgi:hyaluronoglucosaminidase